MIIYKITNKINGKSYIGQTIQKLEYRIGDHFSGHGNARRLSSAIKKYGKESFEVSILETCIDIDDLNVKEEMYINQLNTIHPSGYNLRAGGNSSKISNEQKQAISKKLKGRKRTLQSIEKQMLTRKNRGITPPTLGHNFDDNFKDKKRKDLLFRIASGKHPSLGVKHSQKSKDNMAMSKGSFLFDVYLLSTYIGSWCNKSQCAKDLGVCRNVVATCIKNQSLYKNYKFIKRVV